MKLITTEFKSGGLHEKHVVATWNLGNRVVKDQMFSLKISLTSYQRFMLFAKAICK